MKNQYNNNLKKNTAEIVNEKIELESKPRRLNLALTTRCNIKCKMCVVKDIPWEIPNERIKEVLSLFPVLERIIWQGGEVFLYPMFKELLHEASMFQDLSHEITTNAHLLDREWIELLSKLPVDLNISIDGVTPEVYDHIRKGSKFLNILKILEQLKQEKKMGKVLIVTVMRSNYKQIELFPDFANKYGFRRIIIQPVKSNYDNKENIFQSKNKKIMISISKQLKKAREKAREYGIEIVEMLPSQVENKNIEKESKEDEADETLNKKFDGLFCYAPWQQMFVEWGGAVYPHCMCICDGTNEIRKAGNVVKKSLMEIWNGDKMKEYRRRLVDRTFPDLCNPDCLDGLIAEDMRNLQLMKQD